MKSEHNITDQVSRRNTALAESMGWTEMKVDNSVLFDTLWKIASNPSDSFDRDLQLLLQCPMLTPPNVVSSQGGVVCVKPGSRGDPLCS